MELDVCIKGRRSVRAYTSEPVLKEQIEAVLDGTKLVGRFPCKISFARVPSVKLAHRN